MFVESKRIPIHPDRVATLKPGEEFSINSGSGGSLTVKVAKVTKKEITLKITTADWGDTRVMPIRDIPFKLFELCPKDPQWDDGAREFQLLQHLGYPIDSKEVGALRKACPNLPTRFPRIWKSKFGPTNLQGMDNETLIDLREHIERNPENQSKPGELYKHNEKARKRIDLINGWITHNLAKKREEAGNPAPCNGYSGRKSKKR